MNITLPNIAQANITHYLWHTSLLNFKQIKQNFKNTKSEYATEAQQIQFRHVLKTSNNMAQRNAIISVNRFQVL
jgi:hypothetical protein